MNYQDIEKQLEKKQYNWIVTGAAGFIGSHLVERLLKLNQKVVGLDDLSTGFEKNITALQYLPAFKTSFEFIKGDVCDVPCYQNHLASADFVLHQAALGSVPRSILEPHLFHQANVNGFFQILEASRLAGVKKVVYASSSSVYGDNPELPKKETQIGKPLSPYAATKFIDEVYASSYTMAYQMPVVGLRYFNVFGRRQNPKGAYAAVIPLWIDSMVNGQQVFINGDGMFSRDFCYVENVVQANILAAFSKESANGRAFNIAVGDRTTLVELFGLLKEAVEKFTDKKVSNPVHRDIRQGDIPHSLAAIEQAQKELGYQPTINVRQGILETVKATLGV